MHLTRSSSRLSRLRPKPLLALALVAGLALPTAATAAPAPSGPILIPIPPKDLSVSKIEITQSQQYLNNATFADNSLSAVDRRSTTVRAFVRVTGGWFPSSVAGVQGRLRVYQGATLLYDMLSDNGPITANWIPSRENATHTLNFTFLPSGALLALFGRTLTFTVDVDPFNTIVEGNEGNNGLTTSKFFGCRRAPVIVGVPIDYTAASETDLTTLGLPDPNLIQQGVGDAFVWGAYPFPEYTPGANGRYRVHNGPAVPWASNIDSSGSTLLGDLDTLRVGLSPVPDYIYGWFRNNPFSGNGLGMISGPAAFGNTDPTRYQRTFAHELGHNFGFLHNRSETGTIITAIGETGWDTLNRVNLGELKSGSLMDIMVPGLLTHEAWVHPVTYQDVHDDITNSCFFILPTTIEILTLATVVPVDPGDPWIVRSPFVVRSATPAPRPSQKGRGRVRLLGKDGNELYVSAFDVASVNDHEDERGPKALSLTLPGNLAAEAIEISFDGKVKSLLKKSANPPRVNVTSAQIVDGRLALSWRAEDVDGDKTEALVRYSPDGGKTFIPISVRPRGNDVRVSLDRLPASEKGSLEVLVSDGFNTSSAQVQGLVIGNKAPEVAIVRPHEGDVYAAGANVVLLSAVSDAEDGSVANVSWDSDLDGALGTGEGINTSSLSKGTHVLRVTAVDSHGASRAAVVKIAVR